MIWLSYDLGVRGDYEALYAWLDKRGAQECGDSLAVFSYDWEGRLKEALAADIGGAVQVNRNTRIYAIYRDEGKTRGAFVLGHRKQAPWTGYAASAEQSEDVA